jgi:protein SCO1/2
MKQKMAATTWRTALVTFLIVVSATAAFAHVTRGFRAVTADGVRRIDLARSPRALPAISMIRSNGQAFQLSDIGKQGSHATLVTLVYTRCMTICRVGASGQAYLQQEILARGLENQVKLLTLSFDPANDTPQALSAYARRMRADTKLWEFATVTDVADLGSLLKLFEIVVLPDGLGGYSHNAALFLVDRQGRVSRAYDIDRPDAVLADLLAGPGV